MNKDSSRCKNLGSIRDAINGETDVEARDTCRRSKHDTKIVPDIKPNNILVDWEPGHDQGLIVDRVQIADVEDVCHVPPGSAVVELQAGNWMWRSPEAHAHGPVNKPSICSRLVLW
jgi:hypothetical protein